MTRAPHPAGAFADRLAATAGWFSWLPAHEQAACADDLAAAFRVAAADGGGFTGAARQVNRWRLTAEAYRCGMAAGGPDPGWLGEPIPVPRPA